MKTPLWETGVLVGSFVLLWAWFVAQKGAERANAALPLWWHFFLLVAVGLLVFVMARRIKRLQRALHGEEQDKENNALYPGLGGAPDFTKKR